MTFSPTGFSLSTFKNRYALTEEETWEEACLRLARQNALAELADKQKQYLDKFYDILVDNYFVPGGRIWYNSGRINPQLLNCFVLGDKLDSKEGWGTLAYESIVTSMTGGGCGIHFGDVRPRGASINGQRGEAPGSVELMKLDDGLAGPIKAGGHRRVAKMYSQSLSHPDLPEFLDAKLVKGQLTSANVSVRSEKTSEFIKAIQNDDNWELSWKGKEKKTVKAKDIWNTIVKNAYNSAEPGFLNWELVENESNIWYIEPLVTTNPCLSGDTKVAVADGRMNITIKQLAEEQKDVPVYCLDNKGKTVIRMMRNPRITGYNKPIYAITLDDGSVIKATSNHKFKLKTGEYKSVENLNKGDKLFLLSKRQEPNPVKKYWRIQCNDINQAEHRMIAEFNYDVQLESYHDVHHKDENSLNNNPNNLEILTKSEHTSEHGENSIGEGNANFSGFSHEDIKNHALILTERLNKRITIKEWQDYALPLGLPIAFSKFRTDSLGSLINVFVWAASQLGVECELEKKLCDPREKTLFRQLLSEGYNLEVENNQLFVIKNCLYCNNMMKHNIKQREVTYCSFTCANKNQPKERYVQGGKNIKAAVKEKHKKVREEQIKVFKELKDKLNREPLKKEWMELCKNKQVSCEVARKSSPFTSWDSLKDAADSYNHTIVSIELIGNDTVYNGTVDEFHNFFVGEIPGFTAKNGYEKFNYFNNLNCGEIALSSYDCCCLGHLVLTRFIRNNEIDFALLGDVIRTAVRFLDNVLTVNTYPLPEMKEKSHNLRRIGLGTTGLADMLAILGYKYGSEEGNKFIDKLFRFISKAAYEASVMLAIEKGAFPLCDPEKHVESGFMKRMPAKIRSLVKEHGIRNCAILTQAPTGTVSILSGNCSAGIEPMFAPVYERRYWVKDKRETELVFHPLFEEFMKEGKDVSHFVGSHDLSVRDHLEVQKIVQKHVDNAVSKTINLPNDYPIEDMEKLWLEYLPYLKGTTFYREGTRGFVREDGTMEPPPLTPIPLEEAKIRFKEKHNTGNEGVVECPSGICSI